MKVDRITLQKELARCKKTLNQAERDIEAYRQHLENVQAKAKKEHADESLRKELEDIKLALGDKEEEIVELRERLDATEGRNEDLQKLKDDVGDLEADIRSKDLQIEERENEIDGLKAQASKDADELDDICAELDAERKRVEELEAGQATRAQTEEKLREAEENLQDALAAQRKAENDLDEVDIP